MARVTRAEAARRMGVNKATITRWVQKHPALLDADGRVSVGELEQHRAEVINPALQTRGPREVQPARPAAPSAPSAPTLNDHRARREQANATTAELDLADRLNLTLSRRDVEAAVAAAGDVIRQTARHLMLARAEAISRLDDPRAVERALEDMMREVMAAAAAALGAVVLAQGGADAA